MKILILVDLLNDWALHNRAKAIRKFLPQHDIDIKPAIGDHLTTIPDHGKYDVIHFNFTWGLDSYIDFINANHAKCVLTVVNERSILNGAGIAPRKYKAFLDLFKACEHKTAVNQKMADAVNGVYIPNGIDEDIFSKSRKVVVGYAGTDRENKGHAFVVNACKELGLEFRMVGYKHNGLLSCGDLSHEKMADFYLDLDVFVHASSTEGFSNTVLEALACNIPVIMTRQGAWQSFEGWVDFIEQDVTDIKRALQKYTGRRLVNEKFLWKNIIPMYDEIYQRIKPCAL